MSPPPWTTPAQLDFLHGKRVDFAEAQKNKTLSQFFTTIQGEFFAMWPDPESEKIPPEPEGEASKKKKKRKKSTKSPASDSMPSLDDWLADRKSKITNWFNNHGLAKRRRGVKSATVTIQVATSVPRVNTEVEIYSKRYYASRVKPKVIDECKKRNIEENSHERIAIVNRLTALTFAIESKEVKEEIMAIKKEQEVERDRVKQLEEGIVNPEGRTPEEYAHAIEILPEVLEDFCRCIGATSGLNFMILAGGPDPRHGGEIRTMGYHSTKNQHGLTFGKAYPGYRDAILKPYSAFLHQVYTPEVRNARAMSGTKSEGDIGDEQQELDVTPIDTNPTYSTVDEASASPTPSPSPSAAPSKAEDGRAASEPMNATVTESVASPASTNVAEPTAEPGNTNTSPSTIQPAPASTETVPLTPASTKVIEPASASTKAIEPTITPQPAELIPGTYQAIAGVENPSPTTHIQTRSSNEMVALEQANVATPSDESFTNLLAGITGSWDPNINNGNVNDGIPNNNYGNLDNGIWNDNQQLFNFNFLSEGMGGMKETGQTTGGGLYLPDNMLMDQSMYSHLGPSVQPDGMGGMKETRGQTTGGGHYLHDMLMDQSMYSHFGPSQSNIPWDAAGVASAPKAAYNGSVQGVSAIKENPFTNLDSVAQPESVLINSSIQLPKTSSQFTSPESTDQAAPTPSLEVMPPLATSAVSSDKDCPTTEQDNQPATEQGRSRKPTKSREVIPEWLSSAEDYLRGGVDAVVWKSCLDNWVIFEKEHGMLEHSSHRLPNAKFRPTVLSKWLQAGRKYNMIPDITNTDQFKEEWIEWWTSMQPNWRQAPVKGDLPLPMANAKDKDNTGCIKKGGPSGLVTVLVGLKWWASLQENDQMWVAAVNDLKSCFEYWNKPGVGSKRRGGKLVNDVAKKQKV